MPQQVGKAANVVTGLSATFVVNRAGNMERRARALAGRMPAALHVTVLAEPDARTIASYARATDLVYVMDAGRRGFAAAVSARVARRRTVVELGDPQGALFEAQGRGWPSVAAGRVVDSVVARRADGVVVRGRHLAEHLPLRVPWTEVPDGVDTSLFRPTPSALRAQLGIPDDALLVGLVGAVGVRRDGAPSYGQDLLDAVAVVDDDAVWSVIVGDGPGLRLLDDRARQLGIASRVVFPGRLPHGDVPAAISIMDVCVSTQTDDAVGWSRTTAKLPEYLACDRFVLASAVGGAADVLPEAMLVPYVGSADAGYPARLADRIAALVDRRRDLRAGVGTRALALEHFDYDRLAPTLAEFLLEGA